VARADVDPTRIAVSGWSLGGYLALRAASGEHRLAACIADPGLFGIQTRPDFDKFKDDPRFQRVLRLMNLADLY